MMCPNGITVESLYDDIFRLQATNKQQAEEIERVKAVATGYETALLRIVDAQDVFFAAKVAKNALHLATQTPSSPHKAAEPTPGGP